MKKGDILELFVRSKKEEITKAAEMLNFFYDWLEVNAPEEVINLAGFVSKAARIPLNEKITIKAIAKKTSMTLIKMKIEWLADLDRGECDAWLELPVPFQKEKEYKINIDKKYEGIPEEKNSLVEILLNCLELKGIEREKTKFDFVYV